MGASKVLVIGAAGYLGRTLCQRLTREGFSLRALVCHDESVEGLPVSLEVTRGTVCRRGDVVKALGDAEAIVNCAVVMPDRAKRLPREIYDEVNNHACQLILKVAAEKGLERVILISTAGVLAKNPATGLYDDEAPFRKGYNHYLQSKIDFEAWLKEHEEKVFPRWVLLRPSSIYGPGPSFKWPQVVDLVRRGKAAILGDGSCLHPLIDVRDLADAILKALQQPIEKVQRERITISDCSPIKVKDVMEKVRLFAGNGRIRRVPGWLALGAAYLLKFVPRGLKTERLTLLTPGDAWEYIVSRFYDPRKAEQLLGFKTRIPFDRAMKETLEFHGRGSL